jgi:hypothetical protein
MLMSSLQWIQQRFKLKLKLMRLFRESMAIGSKVQTHHKGSQRRISNTTSTTSQQALTMALISLQPTPTQISSRNNNRNLRGKKFKKAMSLTLISTTKVRNNLSNCPNSHKTNQLTSLTS